MNEDIREVERELHWVCGHRGGSVCAVCYRELAARAQQLAEENEMLRDAILMTGNMLLQAGSQP